MPAAARLGPHVVGVRVVVRHRLPDGRATDTLGVCTAWGESSLTVDSDTGPVEIALADVVAGKPVPPRPSPRMRVSAREVQVRGFSLFDDLVTTPLAGEGAEGWVLRDSPTATARRAHSVLAFGDPGLPLAGAVARVRAHYETQGRSALACVDVDSEQDHALTALGWAPTADEAVSEFQLASVASAVRAAGPVPDTVEETLAPGLVQLRLAEVATGVAAYDDDWVGFRGIEVAPEARGRGLGRAVMAALLAWGAERGARTGYLQVHADNAPALALYSRLGFRTHHRYRYLAPS